MNTKTKIILTVIGLAVIAVIIVYLVQLNPRLPSGMTTTDEDLPESGGGDINMDAGPFEGMMALNFTLEDLQGNEVSLGDFRGRPILINFWATWCPYCVEEMPLIEKIAAENEELVVLAVNLRESRETVQKFVERHNVPFTILLDNTGRTAGEYLVRNLPSSFFIDSQGVVRVRHVGMMSEEQLRKYVKKVLK